MVLKVTIATCLEGASERSCLEPGRADSGAIVVVGQGQPARECRHGLHLSSALGERCSRHCSRKFPIRPRGSGSAGTPNSCRKVTRSLRSSARAARPTTASTAAGEIATRPRARRRGRGQRTGARHRRGRASRRARRWRRHHRRAGHGHRPRLSARARGAGRSASPRPALLVTEFPPGDAAPAWHLSAAQSHHQRACRKRWSSSRRRRRAAR